jgi:hypothetical protein
MRTLCYDEYTLLFNRFREISINENQLARNMETEIAAIQKTL